MTDNCSDKETIIGDLCAHLHTGCTQVKMHFVIGTWDGSERKIAHAVELQLECECRLQVPIDPVLLKLFRHR